LTRLVNTNIDDTLQILEADRQVEAAIFFAQSGFLFPSDFEVHLENRKGFAYV